MVLTLQTKHNGEGVFLRRLILVSIIQKLISFIIHSYFLYLIFASIQASKKSFLLNITDTPNASSCVLQPNKYHTKYLCYM